MKTTPQRNVGKCQKKVESCRRKPTIIIMKLSLCICDDDDGIRGSLRSQLSTEYQILEAAHADEAFHLVQKKTVDLMLLDIQMRTKTEGLDHLPKLVATSPETWIIMLSGLSDFRTIAEAMRRGARDYWVKGSGDFEELAHVIRRTVEMRRLDRFKGSQIRELHQNNFKQEWIGESEAVGSLRKVVEKIRRSRVSVLISGETGTGKEVVAQHLREFDERGLPCPFVAVDSATIQSSTAESQLFGYEKGAFTGADRTHKGLFEEANGGIIYFDELANMPLEIQNKLLRAIQEKEICRMGSARPIPLDFRVVSATNQDLSVWVRDGKFKADLLQRLEVVPIHLPPLRERLEDLPHLATHFLKTECQGRPFLTLLPETLEILKNYPWPGNIRELKNLIAYLYLMVETPEIAPSDLPPKYRSNHSTLSPSSTKSKSFYSEVEAFEKNLLQKAYREYDANVSRMSLELEMDRSHLYAKLKQHGIHSVKKASPKENQT